MNRGKNKSRNTAGETAEPTMTGQKPPFLLFLSPAQNGTRSVQEVADGRVEWHGAIALSCEICRGITAFGRYYHDALATPRKIVVPAARRLAPSPFLDTVKVWTDRAHLDTLISYECFDVFYLDFDMYDRKTLIQQFADDVKSLTKRNKKVYLMLPTIFRADSSDYFVSIAKELD